MAHGVRSSTSAEGRARPPRSRPPGRHESRGFPLIRLRAREKLAPVRTPAPILALAAAFVVAATAALPAASGADEGRATVRLVRLLSEVPDSERVSPEPVHDLRLHLVPGNIVLLRRGGVSAALMPIERTGGSPDSLRYVYYIEHPRVFWLFPGATAKGSAAVANGAALQFEGFRLFWRGDGGLGWLYFPTSDETQNLKISVVSGRTVDRANPMDTRYWIELGSPDRPGF